MQMITHQCAVLGKPIAHSLSPTLHNAAYRALGLNDWRYGRREVDAPALESFLNSLDSTWAGLSLTMPLKRTVMKLGESADRWSTVLSVANTAVLDWSAGDGEALIRLYNTDVRGIAEALRKDGFISAERSGTGTVSGAGQDASTGQRSGCAMILGSGNTARSALAACELLGMSSVKLFARNIEKAAHLQTLAEQLDMDLSVLPLEQAVLHAPGCAVSISTLPAHVADDFAHRLRDSAPRHLGHFLDVVYDPRPTEAMLAWRSSGGHAIGGEMMLLHQAIPQVALMTGLSEQALPADIDVTMLQALQEVL